MQVAVGLGTQDRKPYGQFRKFYHRLVSRNPSAARPGVQYLLQICQCSTPESLSCGERTQYESSRGCGEDFLDRLECNWK